ncbi:MAG: helicase-related protein [Luteolibacter sp.]
MITLYDYQRTSADHLLDCLRKRRAALDAAETGTGKTPKAVTIAQELGLPVGVVCPLSIIPVWKRWLSEAGIAPQFILNYEQLRTGKTPYGEWVHVPIKGTVQPNGTVMYDTEEQFSWKLEPEHLIIFDEMHYCKSVDSLNSKLLYAAKKHHVLMASATPFASPLDLRASGYLMGLHSGKLKDFYQFAINHGAQRRHAGANDLVFYKNDEALRKLQEKIFPDYGDRVTIKELGDKFPKSLVIAESYEIDGARQLSADLERQLGELSAKEENDLENPMTLRLRARQRMELLKIPVMIEKTHEAIRSGRSMVIFVNFLGTCNVLSAALGAPVICGGVGAEERETIREKFQDNSQPILICQIQTGGTGLDLHDLHGQPRTSIISPTDKLEDFIQALGRLPRAGALSPSIQYVLGAAGTVEDKVIRNIQRKTHNLATLTEVDLSLE